MSIEHACYWTSARSIGEARYLGAVTNSEVPRAAITDLQPKGQGGARHFDNLMWELPIPIYDGRDPLHRDLVAVAADAERVAAAVILEPGAYFTTHRRAIPAALAEAGIATRLDALVARLLAPA